MDTYHFLNHFLIDFMQEALQNVFLAPLLCQIDVDFRAFHCWKNDHAFLVIYVESSNSSIVLGPAPKHKNHVTIL